MVDIACKTSPRDRIRLPGGTPPQIYKPTTESITIIDSNTFTKQLIENYINDPSESAYSVLAYPKLSRVLIKQPPKDQEVTLNLKNALGIYSKDLVNVYNTVGHLKEIQELIRVAMGLSSSKTGTEHTFSGLKVFPAGKEEKYIQESLSQIQKALSDGNMPLEKSIKDKLALISQSLCELKNNAGSLTEEEQRKLYTAIFSAKSLLLSVHGSNFLNGTPSVFTPEQQKVLLNYSKAIIYTTKYAIGKEIVDSGFTIPPDRQAYLSSTQQTFSDLDKIIDELAKQFNSGLTASQEVMLVLALAEANKRLINVPVNDSSSLLDKLLLKLGTTGSNITKPIISATLRF